MKLRKYLDKNVQPGDCLKDFGIDTLRENLQKRGFTAFYENLWSGRTGFFARLDVSSDDECFEIFVEGDEFGHMVKDVREKGIESPSRKIVLTVRGGTVETVHAGFSGCRALVIDRDIQNLGEDGRFEPDIVHDPAEVERAFSEFLKAPENSS